MTRLRCTVPFADGEALVGHASRLAACNGVGLVGFLRDMGIALRGVVHGERGAVERLAELSGGEADLLATGAITRVTQVTSSVRGQEVHADDLRRRSLVACPRCLAEDVAAGGLPPVELARSRLAWSVRGIETCPVHRTALRLIEADRPDVWRHDDGVHDFSRRLAPHLRDLDRMADEATECAPTGFEDYLLERLEEGPSGDGLLDALPFHAVRGACFRLGMLMSHGKRARPDELTPSQRRDAEAVGFEALRDGAVGLHGVLDTFHSRIKAGRTSSEGPSAVLGTFWAWLAGNKDGGAYAPLSSSVAEHTFNNYPIAAGATVLGRTLERRRWHSLRSASLEAGLSLNRIRRLLTGTGLLPDDEGRTDALVLFDAERAAPFLAASGGTLQLPDVAVRLGVDRETVARLVQDGMLGASAQPRAKSSRCAQFEIGEVDHLIDRLFDGAEQVHGDDAGILDLAACASRLRFSRGDVLRLVLEDQTLWRGRLVERGGVSALMLRPDEVESRLSPKGGILLDVEAVARRLWVKTRTASILLDDETIPSRILPRPWYGRLLRVVERSDLEAFASEYASTGMLAIEMGRPIAHIRDRIARTGIAPAFPVASLGAHFLRRSDLLESGALDDGSPFHGDAMSFAEVMRALRISPGLTAAIIDAGLLASTRVPVSTTSRETRLVLRADFDEFVARYAPLSTLARERSTDATSMYSFLEQAGVEPVLTTDDLQNPVYFRLDVPDIPTIRGVGTPSSDPAAGAGWTSPELRRAGVRVTQEHDGRGDSPDGPTLCGAEAGSAPESGGPDLPTVIVNEPGNLGAAAACRHDWGVGWPAPAFAPHESAGHRRTDSPTPQVRHAAAFDVLSFKTLILRLGIHYKALNGLVRFGAIRLHEARRKVRGMPVRAVLRADVDAFAAEFIVLAALARERGSSVRATHAWLELAGVGPAFPRDICGVHIYRRADIPEKGPTDADDPALWSAEVARALGTSSSVVSKLLDAGVIAFRIIKQPKSPIPCRIVPASALRIFMDTYTTLHLLKRDAGLSTAEIRFRLAAHGIEPALSRERCGVHLYRRSEVMAHRALDGPVPTELPVGDAAHELGMKRSTLSKILCAGLIPSRAVSRNGTVMSSRLVAKDDLDRFRAEYVTAGMIAKERGGWIHGLGTHLTALGIEPVLPTAPGSSAVYRRRDLPPSERGLWDHTADQGRANVRGGDARGPNE